MGVYYEAYAKIILKDTDEVREIIKQLQEINSDEEAFIEEETSNGNLGLEVTYHGECGYSTADEIEGLLKQLDPHVVGAAEVVTKWDSVDQRLFLGRENRYNVELLIAVTWPTVADSPEQAAASAQYDALMHFELAHPHETELTVTSTGEVNAVEVEQVDKDV